MTESSPQEIEYSRNQRQRLIACNRGGIRVTETSVRHRRLDRLGHPLGDLNRLDHLEVQKGLAFLDALFVHPRQYEAKRSERIEREVTEAEDRLKPLLVGGHRHIAGSDQVLLGV